MSTIDAVASFVSARSNIEVGAAVAGKVAEINQQAAAGLIQALQQGQANIEAAAAEISKAPTLDGTGSAVDRSV